MKKSRPIQIKKENRKCSQPFIIVGCLIEKNGKFLFISEGGKWNQPCGWLELREDILEGAKREAEEETGMEVELTNLLGIYSLIKQKEEKILHAVKFIFLAKPTGKEIKSIENLKTNWFTPEEIKKMDGQFWDPDVQKEIDDYLTDKRYSLEIFKNFTDLSRKY